MATLNNDILIVIPSRLKAVRLPNKPLADIDGKPMIVRVAEQAKAAAIGDVVVACCGEEIAQVVRDHGFDAIITDPALPSGTDRVFQGYTKHPNRDRYRFIINLQGDLPTITAPDLQDLVNCFHNHGTDFDVVTLGCPLEPFYYNDPNRVKIAYEPMTERVSKAIYFSRNLIPHGVSQPMCHIGVYGYTVEALTTFVNKPVCMLEGVERLEQLRGLVHGLRFGVQLADHYPPSVDTAEDLEIALTYWRQHCQ